MTEYRLNLLRDSSCYDSPDVGSLCWACEDSRFDDFDWCGYLSELADIEDYSRITVVFSTESDVPDSWVIRSYQEKELAEDWALEQILIHFEDGGWCETEFPVNRPFIYQGAAESDGPPPPRLRSAWIEVDDSDIDVLDNTYEIVVPELLDATFHVKAPSESEAWDQVMDKIMDIDCCYESLKRTRHTITQIDEE